MKKILTTSLLAVIVKIAASQSISPYVIANAGDFFTDGTYTLSWTLGEIAIETYTAGSNIITQGFQQPDYDYVTIIEENDTENLNISVYPNPANENLFIEYSTENETDVLIELTDLLGRRVLPAIQLTSSKAKNRYALDLNGLTNNMYLLRVISKDLTIHKTYRISKIY